MNHFLQRKAILPGDKQIKRFRETLLRWYRKYGRRYPWRESPVPFHVLLAEMMLQRTKADQVVPIYLKTVRRYATAEKLAKASLAELRRSLNPLGLAWRIPKFKEMAKVLVSRFNNTVPESREALLKLPGVGQYIAGAVLTIAFKRPEWIVDANVVRLFRRYFGIETSREGRRDNHVIELAKLYCSRTRPRESTLAILDHTALICIPGFPRCTICPLRSNCSWFNKELKGQ